MPLAPPRVGDDSTADLTGIIRARRRRVWAKRLTAIGIVVAVLALAAVAWFSPVLALSAVEVEDTELVTGSEVSDFVLTEHAGTPLPQLRPGTIESEVEKQFPRAEDASVHYAGPRSLRITITDRTPVVAVSSAGGFILYDAEAVDLGSVDTAPDGLTVLEADTPDEETVSAVIRFMSTLGEDLRGSLTTVKADSEQGLSGTIDTGDAQASVVFGDSEDASLKMRTALQLAAEGRTEIDVSVPSVPVTD
ncbi:MULTISPECIES: FtsQ-type POTRA domain-containing protein [unclassified Brevibacterium]|uniref:cell division protein FtsQ/DivIB n=1 Tax=unclassified Brevibacterium TaxID=2614124 RepID=UPI0010F60CA4|nr:FtsQ-type POTRA domain-containing protein [Brevibacterium sp. 2SA]MCM1012679.1 FtsQ-type POTRA domain-containing protein [Brevibacterium sp. XM4083]